MSDLDLVNSAPTVVPPNDFNYYVGTIYWTSFEECAERQNKMIAGDRSVDWMHHFKNTYGVFDKALILNCGNGWVERCLFDAGIIKSAIGVDIGAAALATAEADAATIGMPAEYICADINTFDPGDLKVDLIVNNGAMHHVAYIDRVTRLLRTCLKSDGYYLMYDYVGAHRNQYPLEIWSQMLEFNETLPEEFRTRPHYAHLKTMLVMDPTEAIHSDLQLEVLARYFDVIERVDLGGGIAYTLMMQNRKLFDARATPEGQEAIRQLLDADLAMLHRLPHSNLFSYCVARPKPRLQHDEAQLALWSSDEDAREQRANAAGGRYGPVSSLEAIYNWVADLDYELKLLKGELNP